MNLKKRRAFISFPEQHGSDSALLASQKILDGLNLRFSVKIYSQAGIPAEAYIDVYNLNRDDLQFLTTSAATWLSKRSLIQLYAGYDDDVRMLFSGQIMDAPPDGNPDINLRIKGISGPEWMTQTINMQKSTVKIVDLINAAADAMKYPVNMPDWLKQGNEWLNRQIDDFSFTGTPFDLLKTIQEMCGGFNLDGRGFNLSAYNDNIYVWGTAPQTDNAQEKLLVSSDTGMIGYPHATGVGVNIKTLLNPNVKCGDMITLKSKRVPIVNGDYYITAITHEGELRADEWYTTLECAHAANFSKKVITDE